MNNRSRGRSASPLVDEDFTRQSERPDRFATGIGALDTALGGGIPARAGVVVKFPAASPGERVAYALAADPSHRTLYATTAADTSLVHGNLSWEQEQQPTASDPPPVEPVSLLGDHNAGNYAALLESPQDCLPMFAQASIVVDTLTDYPTDNLRTALTNFLTFIRKTDCAAYLLIHDSDLPEHQERARVATDIADIVIEYQPAETADGNDALHIPKLRQPPPGADPLPITLDLDVGLQLAGTAGDTF